MYFQTKHPRRSGASGSWVPEIRRMVGSQCTCPICGAKIKDGDMTLYFMADRYRERLKFRHAHFSCWMYESSKSDAQAKRILMEV